MSNLLIVHHSPTDTLHALTDALVAGARDDAIEGVDVSVVAALDASADDVLSAHGFVVVTPANFGYMSGAMKHFFDTIFLQVGGSLSDDGSAAESRATKKPYGLLVHGRYDTTGAVRSVQGIVQALGWHQSSAVVEILGDVGEVELDRATELGATLAALLT
ncbi:MAG: NAD(P)H-dependent oxidoreductase [Aeromicrobium sp.]